MNPVIKDIWLTRLVVVIWVIVTLAFLVLMASLAVADPPIPRPTVPKWLIPRTNHVKSLPQLQVYPWNYGTNTGKTTNYSWDMMVSTNLQTWSVMLSNVSSNDITHTVITNDGTRRFFRMRGRL